MRLSVSAAPVEQATMFAVEIRAAAASAKPVVRDTERPLPRTETNKL
jgi:hypothetical protein